MGRVYAVDDKGERFLRYIECDRCGRRAEPGSDELLRGGWEKRGHCHPSPLVTYLCPDHTEAA